MFPLWVAPEMVGQDEHSKGYCYAVDWWSLGVCLFELLRGKVHWRLRLVVVQYFIAGTKFVIGTHLQVGCRDCQARGSALSVCNTGCRPLIPLTIDRIETDTTTPTNSP